MQGRVCERGCMRWRVLRSAVLALRVRMTPCGRPFLCACQPVVMEARACTRVSCMFACVRACVCACARACVRVNQF